MWELQRSQLQCGNTAAHTDFASARGAHQAACACHPRAPPCRCRALQAAARNTSTNTTARSSAAAAFSGSALSALLAALLVLAAML